VVPDPALERAERVVVLDAVPRVHADRAVVHPHGEVHGELTFRVLQDLEQAGVELQALPDAVDLSLGHLERVEGLLRFLGHRGHDSLVQRLPDVLWRVSRA